MKRLTLVLLSLGLLVAPRPAHADATGFWGMSPTPATRTTRGFAFGLSLIVVGFEFEYGHTSENDLNAAPGLSTGMINGLVQTPTKTQFYLTAGGGLYRENLGTNTETNIGTNIGGGVKLALAGPIRLRLDYRTFVLHGHPVSKTPQRFYAGINFAF